MKIESIDINASIDRVRKMMEREKRLPGSLKAAIEILILLVTILANRLKLNSSNSSKPPSMDPNRKRKSKTNGKKQGGQNGHKGVCLERVKNPDIVKVLKVDKKLIPTGRYREVGFECRQVIDIKIKKVVTEYRAQILEDPHGKKYVASFPQGITSDIQYGNSIKAHAVYMSQFQLLPYNRIQDYFSEQMKIPISSGTIFNFNQEAYERLEGFDKAAKNKLLQAEVNHADETGTNINGERQ